MTTNVMCSLQEAAAQIAQGGHLLLAGDEHLLRQLPRGSWIGGTIPYFMAAQGGTHTSDRVFVTELPREATVKSVRLYTVDKLPSIPNDAADNGFSVIIIPAGSEAHQVYARDAGTYPGLFLTPTVGWIAGVGVEDIGKLNPLVFDGVTGDVSSNAAVVMHVNLPQDWVARVKMVNLFRQSGGPRITFPEASFEQGDCLIDGLPGNFARWLTDGQVDTKLPLVADYSGAMINTSIQSVDPDAGKVALYAPVFPGIEYRMAEPIGDYPTEFNKAIAKTNVEPIFACNCILNYLYGELEGRQTGEVVGPITFGEVAYQLLNQTMVYLSIDQLLGIHTLADVPNLAGPAIPAPALAPAPALTPAPRAQRDAGFVERLGRAMSGLFGRR
jgi:hypothetical protein